jgi:hypothetical protein
MSARRIRSRLKCGSVSAFPYSLTFANLFPATPAVPISRTGAMSRGRSGDGRRAEAQRTLPTRSPSIPSRTLESHFSIPTRTFSARKTTTIPDLYVIVGLALILALALVVSAEAAPNHLDRRTLVLRCPLPPSLHAEFRRLAGTENFDIWGTRHNSSEVVVRIRPESRDAIERLSDQPCQVHTADVTAKLISRKVLVPNAVWTKATFFADYRRYSDVVLYLRELAASLPAGVSGSLFSIGKSVQGRDIWVFRLTGKASAGPKKQIWWVPCALLLCGFRANLSSTRNPGSTRSNTPANGLHSQPASTCLRTSSTLTPPLLISSTRSNTSSPPSPTPTATNTPTPRTDTGVRTAELAGLAWI